MKPSRATTIVIAQSKGGAGKTTLAAHLGVAWAELGHRVMLIDTDPQGSLARWHHRRETRQGCGNANLGLVATTGWWLPGEILRRGGEHDILLVDSPPRADIEVRTVIKCADLVIVPVQPSPVDVWATLSTLEIVQSEQVPALLVMNRVPARAALTVAMRHELARYDVGLASTSISNRVALAAAFTDGWGITESAHGSSAETELVALAAELWGLLPSSRREPDPNIEVAEPRTDRFASPGVGTPLATLESTEASQGCARVETPALIDCGDDDSMGHGSSLRRDKLLSGVAFLKRRLTQSRR